MKQIALVLAMLFIGFCQNLKAAKKTPCQEKLEACIHVRNTKEYNMGKKLCEDAIAVCAKAHDKDSTDTAIALRRHYIKMGNLSSTPQ